MFNGYHVYYAYPTNKSESAYEPINILAQLVSALHWQKFFGPINLYCNNTHLSSLQCYGVDKIYDGINLDLINNMPYVDGRYWAFSKIYLAQHLLKTQSNLTLIDTDLWITKIPSTFDSTLSAQGLHLEHFNDDHPSNPYIDPIYFNFRAIDFDWAISPMNTAFLYLSDAKLVNEWYELCLSIIAANTNTEDYGHSREMVFLEQRLLPTLAKKLGKRVETLLPVSFNTCISLNDKETLNPWYPSFDSSVELTTFEPLIKHIWGRKKHYDEKLIRTSIVKAAISDLSINFTLDETKDFNPLIDKCLELIN